MEKQKSGSLGNSSSTILNVYVALCVIMVLIILLAPFQRTKAGTLEAEIYLRNSVSESK